MARKPKAPEQDNMPAVTDADILPESQPPGRTEAPPFEVDKQPLDLTLEEEVTLEQEGKAALFETGELFPEPGEIVIPADLTEQLLSEKNGAKIAAAKEAEAAAAETPAPEGQEDTRQEWEKPLDEIKAEQQPKRRGRPPKADKSAEDKGTSGQIGPKSDKPAKTEKAPKQPKAEKASKPPKEGKTAEPPAPPEPVTPPKPIDATRPGEVEQIVYLNLSELHPFKDHPFQVKEDEEMQANTVDSLVTIRKLKEKGVEVYFEKENIYTFDGKGELLLTIMSSLAQEESRSISENVTWGQRKRFSDGKISLPYKQFLGYERGESKDDPPVVNPEQAAIVREIYSAFMHGKTAVAIAKQLTAKGIKTPAGKDKWAASTIESILTNEKYRGSARLQKHFTVDFLTKKTKVNEGEVPQYYIEHSHEAIIDPQEWDAVQDEFVNADLIL